MTNLPLYLPPGKSTTKLLLMAVEAVSIFIWKVLYIRKIGNRNVFLLLEDKRNILLTIAYLLLLPCTKNSPHFLPFNSSAFITKPKYFIVSHSGQGKMADYFFL